jgi:hypothetical protein
MGKKPDTTIIKLADQTRACNDIVSEIVMMCMGNDYEPRNILAEYISASNLSDADATRLINELERQLGA